jgi:ADP-ribose pyrophosphatase YjhB (NUDIX family)
MTGRTYTHPDVFTLGVAEGWAEAETDPARIDWPARQAAAAIPFEVSGGRPVNPCETTAIRYGRSEMGRWGETLMADALVTVTLPPFGARCLLMVERDDGYGWAVPGGHVEPGETGLQAAVRELAEETGLAMFGGETFLTLETFRALAPQYVPDPRASDEAWAVTIPVHIDLGTRDTLAAVTGGDDARRAEWVPADSYGYLADALEDRYAGQVFAAHADMLRQFLPAARATDQGSEDAAAKLDAVRGVLSAFDWERDDRQCALEEIERIVTGPLPGGVRGDGA